MGPVLGRLFSTSTMRAFAFVLLSLAAVKADSDPYTIGQVASGLTRGGVITGVDYSNGVEWIWCHWQPSCCLCQPCLLCPCCCLLCCISPCCCPCPCYLYYSRLCYPYLLYLWRIWTLLWQA